MVLLKSPGFDDRSTCYLTGHKNMQSLNRYSGPTEKEMRSLSSALASCIAKVEPSELTVLTFDLELERQRRLHRGRKRIV